MWLNGPYAAGTWADQNIALDGICDELDPYEYFLADGVYNSCTGWSETPNGLNNRDQYMKEVARCRHEQINGLFKSWGILKQRFRGKPWQHGAVMEAIVNVTQAMIQNGEGTWKVYYNDNH